MVIKIKRIKVVKKERKRINMLLKKGYLILKMMKEFRIMISKELNTYKKSILIYYG